MARIALDIDSTLHHYWDLIDRISQHRFGVELPYEEQTTWGITLLERDELIACVAESHSAENVLAGEPYPGAVETVRAWSEEGHWIHVTSHRPDWARDATRQWLEQIGMPYDDLHCSYDKVTRCRELGVHVLVDDSPLNLERATSEGMLGATIIHPWNADLVERGDVVGARDWDELRARLEPALRALR
jgi:uncharacterized HAD superfamily protein